MAPAEREIHLGLLEVLQVDVLQYMIVLTDP
jgi:hypothetical protein